MYLKPFAGDGLGYRGCLPAVSTPTEWPVLGQVVVIVVAAAAAIVVVVDLLLQWFANNRRRDKFCFF